MWNSEHIHDLDIISIMNLNSEHYDFTKLSTVLSVLMSQKSQNQNVGQNIIYLLWSSLRLAIMQFNILSVNLLQSNQSVLVLELHVKIAFLLDNLYLHSKKSLFNIFTTELNTQKLHTKINESFWNLPVQILAFKHIFN